MISLEKAVEKVHELINQELGPLLDERTMVARNRALGLPMPEGFGQKDRTREKWPEDKLFIGLDSLRNFNIRAKIVGPGGMFVKCESDLWSSTAGGLDVWTSGRLDVWDEDVSRYLRVKVVDRMETKQAVISRTSWTVYT